MGVRTKYKKGDKIVYPLQGVGEVKLISDGEFKGEKTSFYNIYIQASDMTVKIPVENSDLIGIRPLVSKQKALETISSIAVPSEKPSGDWKERYQQNLDKLKQGDADSNASVVASLYCRSKSKPLPILERKLLDNAERLLVDELSIVLGKSCDDIRESIFKKLEVTE